LRRDGTDALKRIWRLTVLAGLVAGCSEMERARVYNSTAIPIVIRIVDRGPDGADRGDLLVTLRPGQSRTFIGAEIRADRLSVVSGRCTRVYVLDGGELWGLRKAGLYFPIELDVRPDASLDLRGETVERHSFRRGREFGFPRRPISDRCRPDTGGSPAS